MATIPEKLALGTRHHQAGQLTEAEKIYHQVLELDPGNAHALHQLGMLALQARRFEAAAELIDKAIRADRSQAAFYGNLAEAYRHLGKLSEAIDCYRKALTLRPDLARVHAMLGTVYHTQGRLEEAGAELREALRLKPNDIDARSQLGQVLHDQGKLVEAEACFRRILRTDPNSADAAFHLGTVFQTQRKLPEAVDCYRAALASNPKHADAYSYLGYCLNDQGKRDEAIACLRRAVELNPDLAVAYNTLAVALHAVGRADEAIANYRRAVEISPDASGIHSNLLYALNFHSDQDAEALFAEHKAWGERHADPLTALSAPHPNNRTLQRRLRIGYVSPHFMNHAVNFFSEPILASHDHSRYEVFCYSSVAAPDETTARLRGLADHWREIGQLTDQQAADLVRQDEIDILVDLAGHIGENRLLVFAFKPAPIQVTYIGYQNTTGMQAMEYRLTDDYSDPPGLTDPFYTEKLVRLPQRFFCYLPSSDAPPVGPLPALSCGKITFGSFNNFMKVTPQVLDAWVRLLERVPNSRLIILVDVEDSVKQSLAEVFARYGIETHRLTLANRRSRGEYLELIGRVDIALDPFPFNGHTTTCDALWQGVPVVTRSGTSYASRFGGSALATLGLGELISHSEEQYLQIAAVLAGDIPRLERLRGGLREQMANSPLVDCVSFTRNLEAEYRRMWSTWCSK